MSILAHLEPQHDTANRRGSPRRRLRLETEGTIPADSPTRVVVRDISRTGLLIETSAALPVGSRLEVQIPEAGPVDAKVVWKSGRYFGCRFEQPISKAAISAALLRSSAPDPAAERGRAEPVAEAIAELELLRARVRQLTASVDQTIHRLEREPRVSLPASPPRTDERPGVAEAQEEEEDTRLSFSMRMRIILALVVGSWALILWLVGAF